MSIYLFLILIAVVFCATSLLWHLLFNFIDIKVAMRREKKVKKDIDDIDFYENI